jgi:hypothetical protein
MKVKIVKLFLPLFIAVLLTLTFTIWQVSPEQSKKAGWMGISLIKPAFAQDPNASFFEDEAGIVAYTLLDKKIDLKRAESVFKAIEKETDKYIIGSFSVSGFKGYSKEDVHLFVHTDGWVVVYYLKQDPTAKMISMQNLGSTKLNMGLTEACSMIGAAVPYVQYYHFQYPDADKFIVLAKSQSQPFRIMIPISFVIYERSWSGSGSINVDNKSISGSSDSGQLGTYGLLSTADLKPDDFHYISGSCALVLIYRES